MKWGFLRRRQNAQRRMQNATVAGACARGRARQTQKGAAASTNGVPSMRTKLT